MDTISASDGPPLVLVHHRAFYRRCERPSVGAELVASPALLTGMAPSLAGSAGLAALATPIRPGWVVAAQSAVAAHAMLV